MKLYFTDNIWAKASGGTFAFIPNLDIIIHNKISPMPGWILNMTGGEFAAQFALLLQVPLNLFFVKKNGYKYGQNYESISEGTGMNQILGTATAAGKWLVNKLNLIDKNHAVDAIGRRKKK